MAKNDLTPYAVEGFNAAQDSKCPYLESSPAADAWYVGVWLQMTGRTAPRNVAASRGSKMHANDMLLDVGNPKQIERIS